MTTALVYRRISSDPTGRQAGVQRQEADCRKLAATLGWDVVDVLTDNDRSAYSGHRPAYEQLLTDLAAGRAQAIITWHPDLLYRRVADLERFVDVVTAHHILVRTVTTGEIDLSSPSGRMTARILGAVATHEIEHGIERMRAAKAAAAAAGRYRGGPRAFGWENGTAIRETEAAEIRDAARRVLAGEHVLSIVRDWTARGVATPQGGRWGVTSLRRVLTRPLNAGLVVADGIEYRAQGPAILTEAEHRGLVALFSDPTRHTGGTRGDHRWLGSGIFRCGRCDDGTTVKLGSGAVYCCRGPREHLSRRAEPVDRFVEDVLLGVLARPDTRLRLHDVPEVDIAAMQGEANAIRESQEELRRALGAREIDLRTFRVAFERLSEDLAKVEERLSASAARSPLAGIADAEDVRLAWSEAPVSRKRAIVAALATVTLLPAPRGRRPDGSYFDSASVDIRPK